MFKNKKLKKIGIDVIKKVETDKIVNIANQVSSKLVLTFENCNLDFMDIYTILLSTNMYYANINGNLSKANYYYKNSSIYFSCDSDTENIDDFLFHECIHRIQEHKNKKNKLTRMGLCEINELSVNAMALNEAAIQYITSRCLNMQDKFFNIDEFHFVAKSEYYPILTCLLSQIVCLIGEEILVTSTIKSNEDFKIKIIDNFGEKAYITLEKSFDEILILKNKKIDELNKESEYNKKIGDIFLFTQQIIYNSFFENFLDRLNTIDEIDYILNKLNKYSNYIKNNSGYNEFKNFYNSFKNKIEIKREKIKSNMAIAVINDNKFLGIFRKIKKLFINSYQEYDK